MFLRKIREELIRIPGGVGLCKMMADLRAKFGREGVDFHMMMFLLEKAAEEVHLLGFYYKLYQTFQQFQEKCIDTIDSPLQNLPLPH